MRNAVFWDMKNPIRTSQETHYVSATEPSRLCYVRIEVFTAVTMKNAVLWVVRCVALVRTDVSEERITFIRVALPFR
jgi:hypothetical protein